MKAVLGAGLEELHGKIASFCGKRVFGKQQLTRLSVPYSVSGQEPSTAQVANRTHYGELVEAYRALTEEQRAVYEAAGEAVGLSGFNYYLKVSWSKEKQAGVVWTPSGASPLTTSPDIAFRIRYPSASLLLTSMGDFYRSTDNGLNWNYSYVGVDSYAECIMELDDQGTLIFVDFSGGAIWKSEDGGASWDSWIQYKGYGSPGAGLGVDLNTWLLVSLANDNVYRTTNSGASYTPIASNAGAQNGSALSRLASGALLAGFTGPFSISRSENVGLSWSKVFDDESSVLVSYFADNGGVVVIAVDNYDALFYVSTDDGLNWSSSKPFPNGATWGKFIFATATELIFIASGSGEVHRSTDNGSTWAHVADIGTDAAIGALFALGSGNLLVDDINNVTQFLSVPTDV